MANEDLIYRLTKAVYSRLGTTADEQAVEQLVTEIYREVEPFINSNAPPIRLSKTYPRVAPPPPSRRKVLQIAW